MIRNWEDWEATAGEISAFSGVVEKFFHNEGLPAADIRKLPPSTNAVFRVGDYVIKIYAPRQAQMEPGEVVRRMETAEKRRMGARLRGLTDRMNTPCAPFRQVDVLTDPDRQGYQENFRRDRKNYLEELRR